MMTIVKKPRFHRGDVARLCWLLAALFNLNTATAHGQEEEAQHEALAGIPIMPSATDRAIKKFDFPHFFYVNREIIVLQKPELPADRHQLLLFLPGTHEKGKSRGNGKGPSEFLQTAANLGYHVIKLQYPDDVAASVCNRDREPKAFEEFRMSIIAGGSSPHITVARTDSIESRLIKLLQHLKQTRPREHWEQFLDGEDGIKWEAIALAGQSQGGGHAALIAVKHRVARVICSGAPKDFNHVLNRPAAWYGEVSATPKGRFFAFNHRQDSEGDCSPEEQVANLRALGLEKLGASADVDAEGAPYHHARILTTDYPGTKVTSLVAHTTFLNPNYGDHFKDVWIYVLTEPVE
jgi:hypothetical protein